MATNGPVQELCQEVTCPICLDYFTDPVSIAKCGHNFCRACLSWSWKEAVEASCPLCKQISPLRSLLPNRQLANIVEITRKLSLHGRREGEVKTGVCEKHQEPLKLFCKDDEAPICIICDRAKEHRDHHVIPLQEAVQEYQSKLCYCLQMLRKERTEIVAQEMDALEKIQNLLILTKTEREKMVTEFRKMQTFLKGQKELLLGQIEAAEKEIAREMDKHLDKLCKERSSLESLMGEVREKIHQPVTELLQDARSTLQRYEEKEKFKNTVTFTSTLKRRIQELCDRNQTLEEKMKLFQDTLPSQLQKVEKKDTKGEEHAEDGSPIKPTSNGTRSSRFLASIRKIKDISETKTLVHTLFNS